MKQRKKIYRGGVVVGKQKGKIKGKIKIDVNSDKVHEIKDYDGKNKKSELLI